MNSSNVTRILIYGLIGVAAAAILWSVLSGGGASTSLPISALAEQVKSGVVSELEVSSDGREVIVTYKDNSRQQARSQLSGVSSLEEVLGVYGVSGETYVNTGVDVIYDQPSPWTGIIGILSFLLPILLIVGLFYFFMRQTQGANNQAMAFGKSRARMLTSDKPTVTFDDVAGATEAKEDLEEVVSFLREPEKFVNFGARIPKGVLMVGPPGTGKTLMAKAVAGEAGVPFFSIAGSEFVEMFVGVGASRVRDLFEQAKRHSPCIIFIDEIDAVGRQRGAGLGGSHDEREQTLNQILVEMDGFDTDTHIIMMAATNRPDILDPALLRPGRFDRRVIMDRPDVRGREEIFRVHMRGKPIARDVNITILAKATPGFTGADIENTVNEAALFAARRDRRNISMDELQEAIERVQLGPERRSRVMTPDEKEIVAYHEAGHAIVAYLLPNGPEVRKVTVIPRGMAGGVTWYLEDEGTLGATTISKFKAKIAAALGGRVAEEIVFNDVTAGASSDLQYITRLARNMVTQLGMSENMGLRVYGERQEMVFLGREISEQRDYSDAIAQKIDEEVSKIINSQHDRVHKLLTKHRDKLDLIAQTLLEVESLEGKAFQELMEKGVVEEIAKAENE
ncbi:MAG: ATP-dependent zinc metalloprotease FtsH [Ardenticatenaceae bacterium]|nr:ATP-dependent zinc metalloprotease FtsH [Ardenticatenaceae bacterium]